jgi:hypothetical protein
MRQARAFSGQVQVFEELRLSQRGGDDGAAVAIGERPQGDEDRDLSERTVRPLEPSAILSASLRYHDISIDECPRMSA